MLTSKPLLSRWILTLLSLSLTPGVFADEGSNPNRIPLAGTAERVTETPKPIVNFKVEQDAAKLLYDLLDAPEKVVVDTASIKITKKNTPGVECRHLSAPRFQGDPSFPYRCTFYFDAKGTSSSR